MGTPSPSPKPESSEFLFWGASESIGEDANDVVIPTLSDGLVVNVTSAGSYYTLVILANRSVAVAGFIESLSSYSGHFGVESTSIVPGTNQFQPITNVKNRAGLEVTAPEFMDAVAGVQDADDKSAGQMHSVFIDVEGNAYATGLNNKGQLCLGDEDPKSGIPTQFILPDDELAVSAAVGAEFTLIVTSSGKLYGCGTNELGQLGLEEDAGNQASPVEIPDLSNVIGISAGLDFSLIRTDEGLFAMGNNAVGQLCIDPEETPLTSPENIFDDSILSFVAGWQSSYVLLEDGSVTSCGLNIDGQLGDGTYENSFGASVKLDKEITTIYAGPSAKSAFFATADGIVYGTGLNNRGQLGAGRFDSLSIPEEVRFHTDDMGIDLSASSTHTVARKSLGTAPVEDEDTAADVNAESLVTVDGTSFVDEEETLSGSNDIIVRNLRRVFRMFSRDRKDVSSWSPENDGSRYVRS